MDRGGNFFHFFIAGGLLFNLESKEESEQQADNTDNGDCIEKFVHFF